MPVVDLHAGPSYICRALSHRECHGNEFKRGGHEFEAEGGAALQGRWRLLERRSESRLHFNDLGTSGMKMMKLNHNRAATVICTHTIKRLQNAMQS